MNSNPIFGFGSWAVKGWQVDGIGLWHYLRGGCRLGLLRRLLGGGGRGRFHRFSGVMCVAFF